MGISKNTIPRWQSSACRQAHTQTKKGKATLWQTRGAWCLVGSAGVGGRHAPQARLPCWKCLKTLASCTPAGCNTPLSAHRVWPGALVNCRMLMWVPLDRGQQAWAGRRCGHARTSAPHTAIPKHRIGTASPVVIPTPRFGNKAQAPPNTAETDTDWAEAARSLPRMLIDRQDAKAPSQLLSKAAGVRPSTPVPVWALLAHSPGLSVGSAMPHETEQTFISRLPVLRQKLCSNRTLLHVPRPRKRHSHRGRRWPMRHRPATTPFLHCGTFGFPRHRSGSELVARCVNERAMANMYFCRDRWRAEQGCHCLAACLRRALNKDYAATGRARAAQGLANRLSSTM